MKTAPHHRLGPALAAVIGLACGMATADHATTRICPAVDEGAFCFAQCGDLDAPDCTVRDPAGNELVECARDGVTRAYLRESDDYVLPAGAERCFVVLDDDGETTDPFDDAPDSCETLGFLVVSPSGFEDADCFDFTCALAPPGMCS